MNYEENSFSRKPTILVADDDPFCHEFFRVLFNKRPETYELVVTDSIKSTFHVLDQRPIDVLLLDKDFGKSGQPDYQNGIKSIPKFRELKPDTPILMMTGSDSIGDCVEAMNLGAYDYFVKNETDQDLFFAKIDRAIDSANLIREKQKLEVQIKSTDEVTDLVGKSRALREFRTKIRQAGEDDHPVLLLGETGTGKTTAARLIHEYRANRLKKISSPFCETNLMELSSTLLERELFGHEKGAFSDAKESRPGLFEAADGGTLFLDEIGEASLSIQTKLLRVLDQKTFRRLGSTMLRRTNFRLICATNQNMEQLVKEGRFRADLYYRIKALEITAPPLSKRPEDIPEIVKALLPRVCKGKTPVSFRQLPPEFIEHLQSYLPDGNVRGIEHMLIRLTTHSMQDRNKAYIFDNWRETLGILVDPKRDHVRLGRITLAELRARSLEVVGDDFQGIKPFMKEVQGMVISNTYQNYGSIRKTADVLKVHHTNLIYHLKSKESKLTELGSPPRNSLK